VKKDKSLPEHVSAVSPLGEAIDGSRPARPRTGRGKASPVETVQVDRRIWATALSLTQGDARRIRVESAVRVVIITP